MTRSIIGIYELITGLFGIIILLANYFLMDQEIINLNAIFQQVFLGVVLYAVQAYAGFGLLNNKPKAIKFSIAIQILQVPMLYLPDYIYKFTSSGFLAIGIKDNRLSYIAALKPIDYTIGINYSSSPMIMVYLAPLLILWGLYRIRKANS